MKTLIDLVEEAGIDLKPVGDNILRGFCPFHEDTRTPNFTVYRDTDSFYCFGCQFGGDKIFFVSRFYKISRNDATIRIYGKSIYQPLLERLEGSETNTFDYRMVVDRVVSSVAYQKLKLYPERCDEVMNVLKNFDERLSQCKTMTKSEMDMLLNNILLVL